MSFDLYEHILLGQKDVRMYDNPHYHEPIKVRPLSSLEIDKIYARSLSAASSSVRKLVMNAKLLRDFGKEPEEIDPEKIDLDELKRYNDIIDYYICYYACKDFQNPNLTLGDFANHIRGVHDMARYVLDISTKPVIQIAEFVKTPLGEEIARIIYTFNIPLVSEMHKLTRVQRVFLSLVPSPVPKIPGKLPAEIEELVDLGRTDPDAFVENWNISARAAGGTLKKFPEGIKAVKMKRADVMRVVDRAKHKGHKHSTKT